LLQVARLILKVLDGLKANGEAGNGAVEAEVKAEVAELCARFPVYNN
jgi:glycine hydroxymethyltransferase